MILQEICSNNGKCLMMILFPGPILFYRGHGKYSQLRIYHLSSYGNFSEKKPTKPLALLLAPVPNTPMGRWICMVQSRAYRFNTVN